MTDLRAKILAVQLTHMCDSYDQDMGQCPCGFKFSTLSELAAHVTDAVIAELGLREEIKYPGGFSFMPTHRHPLRHRMGDR